MSRSTTFYLVRHGQSVWNTKELVQGHNQSEENTLTEKGIAQAGNISKIFKDVHFDAVYSSDLLRAKKTAEIIALERELAVEASHRLREQSHGEHEGMPSKDFLALFTEWENLSNEQRMDYKISDSAETPNEAITRFMLFLQELAIVYADKTILVITHGTILRNLLIKLNIETYDSIRKFENTGYIKLQVKNTDFIIDEVVGVIRE